MSLITNKYLESNFNFINDYEIIEGSDSPYYNCISHSIGIKDKWSWPKIVDNNNYWPINNINETIDSFDQFYSNLGFKKLTNINEIYTGSGKVVLYGIGDLPKHASIQIDCSLWESKMGRGEILRHDPFDLENSIFGNIICLYEKK
jgi:hypothetical protein